eukprot:2677405-Rhodomonas_salina.4
MCARAHFPLRPHVPVLYLKRDVRQSTFSAATARRSRRPRQHLPHFATHSLHNLPYDAAPFLCTFYAMPARRKGPVAVRTGTDVVWDDFLKALISKFERSE